MMGKMSTMNVRFFLLLFFFFCSLLILPSCGGGTNGTGIGPTPGLRISGQIVNGIGEAVDNTTITLLNTGQQTITDEAGSFDLDSEFPGGDASFSISKSGNEEATVTVKDIPTVQQDVEVSFQYDSVSNSAEVLDLTLRARIVRSCSPVFLNTRTIKQLSPLPTGFTCTVETEIKSNGLPLNNMVFALEFRDCDKNAEWQTLETGTTGSSGPGIGELSFEVFNDAAHCVYRLIGPLNQTTEPPLSAQIHTLLKQQFDKENG